MTDLFKGPAYEPPYDGAVQDEFAWHVVKYLREDAALESEAEFPTNASVGPAFFAVDFLITVENRGVPRRIAIEIGGGRSLRDHQRQLRRDAALIASGKVDALYRVRGSDLLDHMDDCLFVIAQWEASAPGPDPFSERGRFFLDQLATKEAKALRLRPEQAAAMVTYEVDPERDEYFSERQLWHAANGTNPFILVRRFDRRFPEAWEPHVEDRGPTLPPNVRPIR